MSVLPLAAQKRSDSVYTFRFVAGKDMFFYPYRGNDTELARLSECVELYRSSILSGGMPVYVDGYCTSQPDEAANLSLRANLLRWVTLTPDLGIEWRINRNWAVLANGSWTSWSWDGKNRRYALWEVAPKVRYYIGKEKRGYVGAMYKAGSFNYKLSETGKQGDIMGGGITGGYRLRLNKALALDFSLGLSYIHADCEKYNVIDGVAGSLDFATDTHGTSSEIALTFTKISEGADTRKWTANVRLLGIAGTQPLLTGTIRFTDDNPLPVTLESNLTEALAVTTLGGEIYCQDDNTVTFTAYYPWNNLQGAAAITADTRAQASQKTFDFLWAQASSSKAKPQVSFSFAHRMAKIVLTIRRGNNVSYQEVQDAVLSLTGFKNNGTFNVTDGTAGATGDVLDTSWTFASNTGDAVVNNVPQVNDDSAGTVSYTLILFPQELAAPLPTPRLKAGRGSPSRSTKSPSP